MPGEPRVTKSVACGIAMGGCAVSRPPASASSSRVRLCAWFVRRAGMQRFQTSKEDWHRSQKAAAEGGGGGIHLRVVRRESCVLVVGPDPGRIVRRWAPLPTHLRVMPGRGDSKATGGHPGDSSPGKPCQSYICQGIGR